MRTSTAATWTPRSHAALLRDQLAGIDAWNRCRRAAADAAPDPSSPEMRLEQARRHDVLQRQHHALIDFTHQQMQEAGLPLLTPTAARLVLVHRNAWFKEKVSAALRAEGVQVVARLENGADAVGVVIAEQPDLLLVEDRLPMVSGPDVIREARRYAPGTVVAAQVANDWEVAGLLDAGAHAAFSRRIPPADVAQEMARLVRA